jgi:uncharacterized protein (TIGR00730 family)
VEKPKPPEANGGAQQQIEAIFASSSYRMADQDVDFLNLNTTRGVRLQLDYLKAETLLVQHNIPHTIVVFGSTRIPEPEEARKNVRELRDVMARSPNEDTRVVLMTGGGPGMMEAANRGAFDVGAKTIGLNISLPHEQYPNPYITPELCFLFHYFGIRKLHFLLRAKALVAFPGGYGTLDELFETLTLIQTRTIQPLPVVLVGRSFWKKAFDARFLLEEGVIDSEDEELFWYAETAEEVWEGILVWHKANGTPLFQA